MMKRMRNAPKASSSNYRFLWLLTGLLIGVFACCLLFLNKKVVVVDDHGHVVAAEAAGTNASAAKKAQVMHKAKKAMAAPTVPEASEQYDFYTMLPKMQSNQQESPKVAVATQASATHVAAKPTKPLAAAEQSMLSPGVAPASPSPSTSGAAPSVAAAVNAEALPAAATQSAPSEPTPTTAQAVTPPEPAAAAVPVNNYLVVAGDFSDYTSADARKAELALSGVEQVKIVKYTKNNAMHYRVVVGTKTTKANAKSILQQVQAAGVQAGVQISA